MTDILVITGLSGAGRSQAADNLEDLGWFVVDNLPTQLIEKVAELGSVPGSTIEHLALVVGSGSNQADVMDVIGRLRSAGHRVRILFLDANDAVLVQRYGSTRRKHPLEHEGGAVLESVQSERELFEPVKGLADLVIDTSDLNVHQLKARLVDLFGVDSPAAGMQTTVSSFGYKHGLPLDADLVLDVRFLPNPYWVERLRPLTGLDPEVRDHVLAQDAATAFLDKVEDLLDLLLPAYVAEGKSYLTLAIGCTGGRHRSVVIADELGRRLRRRGIDPIVTHRDVDRPA
jgi:RNase adapter protein RapZ